MDKMKTNPDDAKLMVWLNDTSTQRPRNRPFRQAEPKNPRCPRTEAAAGVRLYGTGMSMKQIMDIHNLRRQHSGMGQEVPGRFVCGARTGARRTRELTSEQQADLRTRLHEYHPDQLLPAEVRVVKDAFGRSAT
ncbi:MAG: hypothetical protein M5R40_18465 [Anaerolineae bacterium]|nr:hypothetical protein [Anaerolineae bacterium]